MYLYTAYILTSKINAIIKLYQTFKCVVNRTNIPVPQKFEKAGEGKFQVNHLAGRNSPTDGDASENTSTSYNEQFLGIDPGLPASAVNGNRLRPGRR